MKKILTIIFSLFTVISFGQISLYTIHYGYKICYLDSTSYNLITQRDELDTNRTLVKTYFDSGQLRSIENYLGYNSISNGTRDGKLLEYYENGQLRRDIDFKNGKLDGQLLTYWKNGNPKRIDTYRNDTLIEGKCFKADGKKAKYYEYEILAMFPGGFPELTKFISNEIYYPEQARKSDIEGRVFVRFVVNKNGSISDAEVVRGIFKDLDEEALRVVRKMPNWEPGYVEGEAIRSVFTLPVNFVLNH